MHRSRRRWEAGDDLSDQDTLEWRFFHEMVRLFSLRAQHPALRDGGMDVVDTGNPHLLAYERRHSDQRLLIVSNFSEHLQVMDAAHLGAAGVTGAVRDVHGGANLSAGSDLELAAYRFSWLDITRS